jgi:hypothetical protein
VNRGLEVKGKFHIFYLSTGLGPLLQQDWPPQKDFRTAFPELFKVFTDAVPCADLTALNGALNLAAHLATNGVVPDPGSSLFNLEPARLHSLPYRPQNV